jgi:hypothetical protein
MMPLLGGQPCKTLSGGPSCAPDVSAHSNPSLSKEDRMYLIRERFFRLGEDSDITDEQGQPVLHVEARC